MKPGQITLATTQFSKIITAFKNSRFYKTANQLFTDEGGYVKLGHVEEVVGEVYHYLSNKSSKFTKEFEKVTKKYNLNLDEDWNRNFIPGHRGRHTNAYHEYMLQKIRDIDIISKGDVKKFVVLFEQIKKKIMQDPTIMTSKYKW